MIDTHENIGAPIRRERRAALNEWDGRNKPPRTDVPADLDRYIEHVLVDAGEQCPANYQTGFDWGLYEAAIDEIKRVVAAALAARGCP